MAEVKRMPPAIIRQAPVKEIVFFSIINQRLELVTEGWDLWEYASKVELACRGGLAWELIKRVLGDRRVAFP